MPPYQVRGRLLKFRHDGPRDFIDRHYLENNIVTPSPLVGEGGGEGETYHGKLTGQERYRVRQGQYRIVYSIRDYELTVWIVKVGHRKDVYR